MTALRQFLSRRQAEILDQMRVLERELAEIRTTWAALESQNGPAPRQSAVTIKDMIRQILRGRPDGLSAGDILSEISERFGTVVERTSLSPQLSRLRKAGDVTLEQGRWYSTQISLDHLALPHHQSSPPTTGGSADDLL
jgi:hypothetical protein